MKTANGYELDTECFYGRHDFTTGKCSRRNCTAEWRNRVSISAKRWFQKTYGNTYHSVTVTLPSGEALTAPFSYGYGSQYEETALELLRARFDGADYRQKLTDEDRNIRLHEYLARRGYYAEITCSDVDRKRDL